MTKVAIETGAFLEVRSMLFKLLEQAREVEADIGTMPTAEEALTWALAEVDGMIAARQTGADPMATSG